MSRRVLHALSQRPSFTGSGVSLDAIVRCADRAGWEQRVIVGVPHDDPQPRVGGLEQNRIHPLRFGLGKLDFPLPGMSDVMPYTSSRFSALSESQLQAYCSEWLRHISAAVEEFRPDVIHSRHVWLLSSLIKDAAPNTPVVTQCHATGLRQMELCPHLAERVRRGCARNERFLVLHRGHADALAEKLGIEPGRIHVVGSGCNQDVFHARGRGEPGSAGASPSQNGGSADYTPSLLYAGKYSHAKGLPQLLDAFERLESRFPGLTLHVAGDGAGDEAERLRARMARMAPRVVMHGQLGQKALADLMRRSAVFVLPSFYEGLPLVLVEALACGCRLACSDLPGVRESIAPRLGGLLELVGLPRLKGPDVPMSEDLPAFVDRLTDAVASALREPPVGDPSVTMPDVLAPFTWSAVFERIERVWTELADELRV